MKGAYLAVYIIVAWMVHAVLVTLYLPLFPSTAGMAFRAVHFIEIGAVMTLATGLFRRRFALGQAPTLVIAFTTLGIIDLIFFKIIAKLITSFDVWHFVAAFSAVLISTLVTKGVRAR